MSAYIESRAVQGLLATLMDVCFVPEAATELATVFVQFKLTTPSTPNFAMIPAHSAVGAPYARGFSGDDCRLSYKQAGCYRVWSTLGVPVVPQD